MLISKFDTTNVKKNILEFEEKYNFKFPNQYKQFLLKFNGGETPYTNFKISRVGSDLDGFYGFNTENKYSDYSKLEKIISFKEWLKDSMLPIGKNCFGDDIMIGIGQENGGKIYFHYHDRPKRYIELTEDFVTFIGKCKSKKIGHIRTIEERKADMIKNGFEDRFNEKSIKNWQAEIDFYANIHQEELVLNIVEPKNELSDNRGIPKFQKLEQVVPLPFHEKTNQLIIDFKELSEKALWEKYNLQSVWHDVDDYIAASKKYGNMGKVIINVLVDFGFILQLDYKEEVTDYEVENFWGDEPVKLVQFDLENDQYYYAYIPQSTDLKSIFDVKIYEVDMGGIQQGGLDMNVDL